VQDDPEIARRDQARLERDRQAKAAAEREHAEHLAKIRAETEKRIAAGAQRLTRDTPVGSRVFDHWQQAWARVVEHSTYGPVLKADGAAEPERYAVNKAALEAVRPKPKTVDDLDSGEVSLPFGAHWIDPSDLEAFIRPRAIFVWPVLFSQTGVQSRHGRSFRNRVD
jgi:hypothetical protein